MNNNKTSFFLVLSLLAAVACSGSEFSASDAKSQGASGSGSDAGEGSGDSGSKGSAGSSQVAPGDGGEAGTDAGGTAAKAGAASGGSGTAGSTTEAGANSGGTNSGGTNGGSGTGGTGTAGKGGTGTSGSAGMAGSSGSGGGGVNYHCAVPAPGPVTNETLACMKKVCSDVGYECGAVPDSCDGAATACGSNVVIDCSKFLPLKGCAPYTKCDTATHQCGEECKRVTTGNKCSVDGSSFRYVCTSDETPGCYDTDPGAPGNQHICECSVHQDVDGFCCPQNKNTCTVKYTTANDPIPACNNRRYEYTCSSGVNPDPNNCAVGQNGFCCSSPGIE